MKQFPVRFFYLVFYELSFTVDLLQILKMLSNKKWDRYLDCLKVSSNLVSEAVNILSW